MGRGLKPNRTILRHWTERLDRENKRLVSENSQMKEQLQVTSVTGMLLTKILKEKHGYTDEDINKAMTEASGIPAKEGVPAQI